MTTGAARRATSQTLASRRGVAVSAIKERGGRPDDTLAGPRACSSASDTITRRASREAAQVSPWGADEMVDNQEERPMRKPQLEADREIIETLCEMREDPDRRGSRGARKGRRYVSRWVRF